MRLAWTSNLETGIRQIDLQHQELIALINELAAAHEENTDKGALENVLPKLTAYVMFHFGTEESLMQDTAMLTHMSCHMKEHKQFAEKVASIKAVYCDEPAKAVSELLDYLKSWLVNHIITTDKELARLILDSNQLFSAKS
jgi:hemerythrin-like metal-binding protein